MTIKDEQIIELSDRSQSRTKLPVFYGSKDNYYHGFREVIANANDEIRNNFEYGEIKVWLNDDNQTISVFDSGRGIPFWGETNGKPNYELLFLTLFAGTNYENIEKGKVTTGTNGLGITVLNYTSEYYKVESWRNGTRYEIEFENGGCLKGAENYLDTSVKQFKDNSIEHGTKFTFKLDKDIYTKITYNPKEIENILIKLSGVSNKLTITYTYNGEEKVFHYDSTEEYFKEHTTTKLSPVYTFPTKQFETNVEIEGVKLTEVDNIGVSMCLSADLFQETYLNYTYLSENGTIYDGVIEGLRRFFNKNSSNSKIKFTFQDIEMSFSFVGFVESTNCEFANQTKFSTKKELYKKIAIDYIQDCMEIFKLENEQVFQNMLNHLVTVNKFNDNNEKKRKDFSKKLTEKASNCLTRPEKFVPCGSKNKDEIELIIIEGDSAMNAIKSGRNNKTMCIYPLKGKPMNPMKNSIDLILNNKEILELFQILGCGVTYKGKKVKGLPEFNIDNLNLKNILIMTDRDVDGGHIESLLLGIFYMLAPQLIEDGRVWIVRTPLYIIKQKGKADKYLYSETEKNQYVSAIEGSFEETRYKGLGGISPQVMNFSLKEDTRVAMQVTFEDAERCKKQIELFLSEETAKERKEFIEEFSRDYFDYSLLEG